MFLAFIHGKVNKLIAKIIANILLHAGLTILDSFGSNILYFSVFLFKNIYQECNDLTSPLYSLRRIGSFHCS